jgi:hypothetical protein
LSILITKIFEREVIVDMSKQGMQNKDQIRKQIERQDNRNDIELGTDYQIGNTQSQSQKKSGRQVNKK